MRLPEITDQPWCPAFLRNAVTECLQFFLCLGDHYGCAAGRILWLLDKLGSRTVVDLCSGSGGPWPRLLRELDARGAGDVSLVLTDRFPNMPALRRIGKKYPGRITICPHPASAGDLPAAYAGVRTLFTSFHHFNAAQARALLAAAAARREGIAVFEFTRRSFLSVLLVLISPVPVLLFTPCIRPLRWSRLFWTYAVPLIPLVIVCDGVISCLRTRSPCELAMLAGSVDDRDYRWEYGLIKNSRVLVPVTYLIGYPEEHAQP